MNRSPERTDRFGPRRRAHAPAAGRIFAAINLVRRCDAERKSMEVYQICRIATTFSAMGKFYFSDWPIHQSYVYWIGDCGIFLFVRGFIGDGMLSFKEFRGINREKGLISDRNFEKSSFAIHDNYLFKYFHIAA